MPFSRQEVLTWREMAFMGYQWRSKEHIDEVLDDGGALTLEWCKQTAKRLGCVVCCGLARRSMRRRLNSMVVAGPDGQLVDTIDKTHLYATDKTWAEAGDGFQSRYVVPGLPIGPVGFGICMDINPRDFQAPPDDYEFAMYHLNAGSRLIVFSSAWCRNHPDDVPEAYVEKDDAQAIGCALDVRLLGFLRFAATGLLTSPTLRRAVSKLFVDDVGEQELSCTLPECQWCQQRQSVLGLGLCESWKEEPTLFHIYCNDDNYALFTPVHEDKKRGGGLLEDILFAVLPLFPPFCHWLLIDTSPYAPFAPMVQIGIQQLSQKTCVSYTMGSCNVLWLCSAKPVQQEPKRERLEQARLMSTNISDCLPALVIHAVSDCHEGGEKGGQSIAISPAPSLLRRLEPLRGQDVHFVCADRVGEEPLRLLGKDSELRPGT
ncbi:unnamed protein product [Polarella glacialis]|uniref:CN hydrolase domain-containing protein n=1 Tax=Polarella glacialis TaxID=89957 RepID=A0A813IE89_POLGL|nr:unnamed protein product [Polarella glacialis]